jgi:Na+/proline symporter
MSEKQKVLVARLGTLGAGVIAYFIAFASESITGLVETASSLGGPSVLIITIIALWVKKGNSKNAVFAILMSIVTWVMTNFFWEIEYPIILTVVICALSYFISLPFTKKYEVSAVTEPTV